MSHNILITGGSGYLGGTLLARLGTTKLPSYNKLFALVRTDEQAQKVKELYGAEPFQIDAYDEAAIHKAVVNNGITIVFHLIDPVNSTSQVAFIKALGEVKKQKGGDTTGAKVFSSHAGAPNDRPLLDTEPDLYEIQKSQKSHLPLMNTAVQTNNTVIELSETLGVRSYVFAPCIVYGKGEGFGNPISIQTVAIVKAAKETRRVYTTDEGKPTWPVCHILDNTNLYLSLLGAMLSGSNPDHGKNGYYLAASGSVVWTNLYAAMAATLLERGVIDDATIEAADHAAVEKMAQGIGYPPEFVNFALGGNCTFTAKHGEKMGWKPTYKPEHILEDAGNEVDLILANIR
ncbi:hypothetical protein SCAR479_11546 [Seiridium cardinale]|uniref:NAD-dependent epimerase/dehydratase domain-containing protein n=1 Tax=Seiridium cardinale TaxID=138064 RepID=A0ABR2XD83_9PEZI